MKRIQHRLYSASALSPDHREPVPADAQFADLLLVPAPGSAQHPNLMQLPTASADRFRESLSKIYDETVVALLAGFQPHHWYHYRVIAKGANRVCVHADDNSHQCLKFLTAKGATATVDPNTQEWAAYQRWQQRSDARFSDFFSPCVAMESTPHGEALRCELVCSDDGSLARPIYYYFSHQAPFSQAALHRALDQFEQYVHINRLPLFDLNAGNLLVVIDSKATPRLVCADAKSLDARKELLPLSRWFEWARRRKVNRRFQRLHQRIDQRWPDTEEKTP
ncbi:YrbL family protein [Simiduia agarivorans]|uniref:YrbL family protein n=1 Tax=Simiduia agarivorans TaxID=447471 RepID=UPI0002D3E263|nr:YrbL family protein [Simiduia agarivorans]